MKNFKKGDILSLEKNELSFWNLWLYNAYREKDGKEILENIEGMFIVLNVNVKVPKGHYFADELCIEIFDPLDGLSWIVSANRIS